MLRKIFGGKKDDDEDKTDDTEGKTPAATEESVSTAESPAEEIVETSSAEEPVESPEATEPVADDVEPATTGDSSTMPVHASIQDRLKYMLTEGASAECIEAPDTFKLEFMAMGERFTVVKESMAEVTITSGSTPDEDVFIRIGNDVVAELLDAANFDLFSQIYLKYYKNAEPGKFVKIELRKPITDLNRRGYARVPALKLLIGAARM